MPAANVLCAAILGYGFFGMNGMCIAAIVAWAPAVLGSSLVEWQQDARAAKALDAIGELQRSLNTGMSGIAERLPATRNFYSALLDGTSLDDYRLLEMREPKSAEEWEQVWPRVWLLLRRRLVHCYGLSPPRRLTKPKTTSLANMRRRIRYRAQTKNLKGCFVTGVLRLNGRVNLGEGAALPIRYRLG